MAADVAGAGGSAPVNWKIKAVAQLLCSVVPGGDRLHYLAQRHVVKSLPCSDHDFADTVARGRQHLDALQRHAARPLEQSTFYEFGAGWDLIIPLVFRAFGVRRHIVADVRRLASAALVADTLARLEHVSGIRVPGRGTDGGRPRDPAGLLRRFGIEYRAPCDARRTGMPAASIDCITSTNTLEHVPPAELPGVIAECRRLLADTGVMSCRIDYQDHYSYADPGCSAYNFLRYGDGWWRLLNPRLHYQNRLRHRDYLGLLEAAGFEVIDERRRDGTPADLAGIARLGVAPRFAGYAPAELAVRHALIVARPRARRRPRSPGRPALGGTAGTGQMPDHLSHLDPRGRGRPAPGGVPERQVELVVAPGQPAGVPGVGGGGGAHL